MSYEGYDEYICEKGHYFGRGCYENDKPVCPLCNEAPRWWHPVDQTNGEELDNPSTYPAEKHIAGTEDRWRADHHNSRYATLIELWTPDGNAWRPYTRSPA